MTEGHKDGQTLLFGPFMRKSIRTNIKKKKNILQGKVQVKKGRERSKVEKN